MKDKLLEVTSDQILTHCINWIECRYEARIRNIISILGAIAIEETIATYLQIKFEKINKLFEVFDPTLRIAPDFTRETYLELARAKIEEYKLEKGTKQ